MTIRSCIFAAAFAALALSRPASADYLCKPLDVPGATTTQLWQVNNAGSVAASSSLGGYTYSGGVWAPQPAPPAASGYSTADLSVLGINDSGATAGNAFTATGSQGYILNGSTYSFFNYLGYPYTEPRALSNSGIVTGWAYGSPGPQPAFVYNPNSAPDYPAGFTEIVPTLPDGTKAGQTIPGAMNAVGQFVGSARFPVGPRYGFIYDPRFASHGGTQPITLFQIEHRHTAARGINDNGAVAGFTADATGKFVGFVQTSKGYQLVPCPELNATGIFGESINNNDVFSGIWSDAAGNYHGYVAYPNVVLPVTSAGGVYTFDAAVTPNTPVFLDPPAAVGFQYAVGAGNALFKTLTLPIGVGSNNVYTVITGQRSFTVPAGEQLDLTRNGFADGVSRFEVLGIDPGANLDPRNPTAFVTQVSFAPGGNGKFTGSMTPMNAGDEFADLLQALDTDRGSTLRGPANQVQRASAAYAANDVTGACTSLTRFTGQVAERSFDGVLSATFARRLTAEADAIRNALSCPPAPPASE